MTSCDDVIDDVITQLLALIFCGFYPQNRKNRRKFVANNDLKFKKKQLELLMMYFQSLQIETQLNLATKNFRLFCFQNVYKIQS